MYQVYFNKIHYNYLVNLTVDCNIYNMTIRQHLLNFRAWTLVSWQVKVSSIGFTIRVRPFYFSLEPIIYLLQWETTYSNSKPQCILFWLGIPVLTYSHVIWFDFFYTLESLLLLSISLIREIGSYEYHYVITSWLRVEKGNGYLVPSSQPKVGIYRRNVVAITLTSLLDRYCK